MPFVFSLMDNTGLADQFERQRVRLRGVAYRMLGSRTEAEDAVQEAWLRLTRSDADGIEDLGRWLTTVVARVCLDQLRSRRLRGEQALDDGVPEPAVPPGGDPEEAALLADSISLALLTVLDTLTPAERVSFVLHDMFDLRFEEIAVILGRSSAATRQLASRARRRVRGRPSAADDDPERTREVVQAFLVASRSGDLGGLLALLDPAIVLTADRAAVDGSAARRAAGQSTPDLSAEVTGPDEVVKVFAGRARAAHLSLIDGAPGAAVRVGSEIRAVFLFTIDAGRVQSIEIVADPVHLQQLEIYIL